MRLIDANALKDYFHMGGDETSCEGCVHLKPRGCYEELLLSDFCSAIDEQPTIEAETQWVPCSERMPEEDGVYLVYAPEYRGGSSSSKEWHDGVMFAKCKNGKWSIEHGYYSRPNCAIAWMPLPEPYKGDTE